VREAGAAGAPLLCKTLVIPVESAKDADTMRTWCDPDTCIYCRACKGVDSTAGPPICPSCLAANPGPQMLLVSGSHAGRPDATVTEIQVLHGGDPSGWRVKPLTRADEKLFAPKLAEMQAALLARGA
jgi:hypothetical protein